MRCLDLAGDILPLDKENGDRALGWLDRNFRGWLESIEAERIIGIAGNHDFAFERHAEQVRDLGLPWTYLQDSGTEYEGLSFWGLPWVPNLSGWAFYGSPERLEERYGWVPQGIDIVISHGPPQGILDNEERKFGALQANDMVHRINPQVFVCGHIHEGYGSAYLGLTDLYNVAHCDILYNPVNPPQRIWI